jgi:hypothetical protein
LRREHKKETERISGIMNKNRTLLVGALAGAVTGLIAAMLLNRRSEEQGTELALTTGDGMKLGVMVIGLLRAIASLGEEK